jgi:hypothetical protein
VYTTQLSTTFQQLVTIDIILDHSPGKTTIGFLDGFETGKNIPVDGRRNLIDLFSLSWMRKAFDHARESGRPRVLPNGKGLFFIEHSEIDLFCGQGMDK